MYQEGDIFEGVILETCRDESVSRPRVRPVGFFPASMRVEFPRELREVHPIGSRFRATVQVSQKHNSDGSLKGDSYLHAKPKSIALLEDYTPQYIVMAVQRENSKSGLIYDYICTNEDFAEQPKEKDYEQLRKAAWGAAVDQREAIAVTTTSRKRGLTVGLYALARSQGVCEACSSPAPFVRRNGNPYLEVHHITELANGGADAPDNVAAICPNCHARVTHGKDAAHYNKIIRDLITAKEACS